jgi:hypothetical protein
MIEGTLNAWAVSIGCDDRTLAKMLVAAGVKLKPRKLICAKDVFRAATGDLRAARTRRENAEADIAQVKARFAKNDAVTMSDCEDYVRTCFQPIREAIIPMPDQMAALCCPSDPENARQHLSAWVAEFFKRVNFPHSKLVASKSATPDKA